MARCIHFEKSSLVSVILRVAAAVPLQFNAGGATCYNKTGGSCWTGKCDKTRGAGAVCHYPDCVCKPGFCADVNGQCVTQPGKCEKITGGTCMFFGCSSWRGGDERVQCDRTFTTARCNCRDGFCADPNGECVPADRMTSQGIMPIDGEPCDDDTKTHCEPTGLLLGCAVPGVCQDFTCRCPSGCAAGGVCHSNGTCVKDTGLSCRVLNEDVPCVPLVGPTTCNEQTNYGCQCAEGYCADSAGVCHKGPHRCDNHCAPLNTCKEVCSDLVSDGGLKCYACLLLYIPFWDRCCDCIDMCGAIDVYRQNASAPSLELSSLLAAPMVSGIGRHRFLAKPSSDCPIYFSGKGLATQGVFFAFAFCALVASWRVEAAPKRGATSFAGHAMTQLFGMCCATALSALVMDLSPSVVRTPGGCGWYFVEATSDCILSMLLISAMPRRLCTVLGTRLSSGMLLWATICSAIKGVTMAIMVCCGFEFVAILARLAPSSPAVLFVLLAVWPSIVTFARMMAADRIMKRAHGTETRYDFYVCLE